MIRGKRTSTYPREVRGGQTRAALIVFVQRGRLAMPRGRAAAALLGCSVLSDTSDAVRANARCESLVPKTLDVVPSRSPQAVHTLQLPFLIDKDIIEIGTRGGDGMQCFARVAKTAIAIELRPHYCELLRSRAQALQRPFSVMPGLQEDGAAAGCGRISLLDGQQRRYQDHMLARGHAQHTGGRSHHDIIRPPGQG